MAMQHRETLTPREYEEWNQRKEMFELQAQHELAVKDKEIALATLEAKWSSWLRIPLFIIMLPVRILFGIAYCIAVARKFELSDRFWSFMGK